MPAPRTLLVYGDEIESILTAVSAARYAQQAAKALHVILLRPPRACNTAEARQHWLGGLSTLGGLSYMDITPEHKGPLFAEFLERAGVVRVALNPEAADSALKAMLDEAKVLVQESPAEGPMALLKQNEEGRPVALAFANGQQLAFDLLIDASPDADLARQTGVPYITGLGTLLSQGQRPGPQNACLGVSPVFRIAGVEPLALMDFEAQLRSHPDMGRWLAEACPTRSEAERADLLTRPCFSPETMDYIDILNPVLGVAYHIWKENGALTGFASGYSTADVWIDGGNVSRLRDGTLGFNGMVTRIQEAETLLQLSHGAPIPDNLMAEMQQFERFLQQAGGLLKARVLPPQRLYVRQTFTLQAQHNMTALDMISGGVAPEEAIGTYSYWLDLRGIVLGQYFDNPELPKPVFNVGLKVAYPQAPHLSNLAFVGRSAGYSPLGQGAGRIVQHNSMLGEAVGIAAAMALEQAIPLSEISAQQVRTVLDQRAIKQTGTSILINGSPVDHLENKKAHPLLLSDCAAVNWVK